jgi:hypothetical protein
MGTPTIIGEALAPIWNLTLGMFAPVHGGKLASAHEGRTDRSSWENNKGKTE